jgi:phenylacetate-CoA ligase
LDRIRDIQNRAAGLRGLFQSEMWTREQLRRYQSARLRALVRHAWERVPFYRRRMEAAGLHWKDVRGLEDLARIPVTERSAMNTAPPEDLLAAGTHPDELLLRRTSGSSGKPLSIWRTWFEDRLLHAFRLRVMFAYGMRWDDRRAHICCIDASERAWWVRLGLLEQHSLSALDGPDVLRARLLRLKPTVIEGYTQTLAATADRMSDEDRNSLKPRFVVAGAEPVRPDLRRRIAEGFGARVYDAYGSEEFNLIAAECPKAGVLHVSEASVLVEILREGRPAQPGETGELIGTALHSFAMPFLRFRLADSVRQGPVECPCGAGCATIAEVRGREYDMLQLPGGRSLHPYSLLNPLLDTAPWIRQFQLVQDELEEVRLKVVAPPGVTNAEEKLGEWLLLAHDRCGALVRILVEQVTEIPGDPSGKIKLVRCGINRRDS